ncbi:MAG: histidinol-phosphate transaminase [Pseudomonadota bacterium]|nr:histidinol-phosphate transaminase [Pseudomonadota bacterium]
MKKSIPYNPNIKFIKPYEPGKSKSNYKGKLPLIKLSSNESCIDFSKHTLKKIIQTKINLSKYPDSKGSLLREKISKIYKVNKNNIVFGNGSDEIFFLICNAYLNSNLEGLYSKYGFLIYPLAIKAAGAKAVFANEVNYKASVENLLLKANKNTRVCFIANPNNPTGTYLDINEIKYLREKLPSKCLLVVDAAYSEYVKEKNYSDMINFAKKRSDVIVTHTFSKIFGLSALRLGWAYCPSEVSKILEKIRPAFNINAYAQAIGSIVLDDKDFLKKSIKHNIFWKNILTEKFNSMGVKVIPSVANFITIIFKNAASSNKFVESLEKKNIFVRKLNAYKLSNCVRITIGTVLHNKQLLKTAENLLKRK